MKAVIDSAFSCLEEAIDGTTAPKDIIDTLALVTVHYYSFDEKVHEGQLVLHEALACEVQDIFTGLMGLGYPIHKVMPVVAYGWDDEASMANNNSSAFNYRVIMGTERLSNHSFGNAIDINPLQNPYFARNNRVYPAHARYQMEKPGTLVRHGAAVELFKSKGWLWGGDWTVPLDYQHFERPL